MLKESIGALLQSPSKSFTKFVEDPIEVLTIVRGEVAIGKKNKSYILHLFSDTDIDIGEIETYLNELNESAHIHSAHQEMSEINGISALLVPPRCVGLYILVRHYQPSTIVETGSYFGHSTLYILAALRKNSSGELHSFDAHPNEIGWFPDLPQDFELGYMVPDDLKKRWELHRGDINNILEDGLKEIGEIDLFFHDSDHKESHKRWEFELAQQYLDSDGILASHDVGYGNPSAGSPASYAFVDMAKEMGAEIHSSREFEPGDEGEEVFAFLAL